MIKIYFTADYLVNDHLDIHTTFLEETNMDTDLINTRAYECMYHVYEKWIIHGVFTVAWIIEIQISTT